MNGLDEPVVDLADVQADEALLNMLGGGPVPDDVDAELELARLLVAWRRDVNSEPFGELITMDPAMAAIGAHRWRRAWCRWRTLVGPLAATGAVLVIAAAAVGLAARSAEPGGRLWPVAQVLYAGYARSVQAADTARAELGVAAAAVRDGRTADARRALDAATVQLPLVVEAQGRADLVAWHAQLGAALAERGQR